MVEVELLQALAGREPGGADAALAAVGLPGGDLALQAGDQELLVRPGLRAGPFGQPRHRLAQRRRLQRPGQERHLGGQVPAGLGGGRAVGHHATVRVVTVGVEAERGVVVAQAADLHLRFGDRAQHPDPFARAAPSRRRRARGRRWSGARPRSARGRRPAVPSQSTRTRCQVGDDLDPAADHRRDAPSSRCRPGARSDHAAAAATLRHPVAGATGGRASIACRSAVIRSVGAQPSARRGARVHQRAATAAAGR